MTPRPAIVLNENHQVRRAFVLGAYIRLSPLFLLSAPEASPRDSFDDCITATRAYCMGDELDNRAAESAWREQSYGANRPASNGTPTLATETAANDDRACKAAA